MSLLPSLTPEKRTELTEALKNKDVGWYVKYEWNIVLSCWNSYLYSKKQEEKGRCEKAFIYNTTDECLQAICKYKNIKV